MTTEAPEHLYGLSPVNDLDANTKALNRLAQAVEQLVFAVLDKTAPIQATPQNTAGLAALPPVQPLSVNAAGPGVCPTHRTPWKIVPAGISKKNGKPYEAFMACSTAGCDQRPPR